MEIRQVEEADMPEITRIYSHYVINTDISFETEPPDVGEMTRRMEEFTRTCPYFVCVADGRIAGYCYAHPWKARAAYAPTLETTVYLAPEFTGRGIGSLLMERLIEACRQAGFVSLIACITYGNKASCHMHKHLGFRQVSHFRSVGRKFGRTLDVVDFQLIL